MPRVGFESLTPALEWAKTIHTLDRAATVISEISKLPTYTLVEIYCRVIRVGRY
jgi:hypothetical protein